MARSGQGRSGSSALTFVLALFMIGYVAWAADRLTALTQAAPAARDHHPSSAVTLGVPVSPAASPQDAADTMGTCGTARNWLQLCRVYTATPAMLIAAPGVA
jgi:hypothetical protein